MGNKSYHPQAHTSVKVEGLDFIRTIILVTNTQVWIGVTFSDFNNLPKGSMVMASDDEGYSLVTVPKDCCLYYTDQEADDIQQGIDADDRLLRYAR